MFAESCTINQDIIGVIWQTIVELVSKTDNIGTILAITMTYEPVFKNDVISH